MPETRNCARTGPTRRRGIRRPDPALVEQVMQRLDAAGEAYELPVVEKIAEEHREDAFRVLIATMLSARTQDATTDAAARRLFARARTPASMAALARQTRSSASSIPSASTGTRPGT